MVAETEPRYSPPPPTIVPSSWSGFPEEWVPTWGRVNELADTAWACIDLNARALASMPPYLVGAAPTIDAGWLTNPSPGIYSSWDEFAKQLFWDWQAAGEAFVVATAFYSTGWPARFHVAPPWTVNVEMDGGVRSYSIGRVPLLAETDSAPSLQELGRRRARARAAGGGPGLDRQRAGALPLRRLDHVHGPALAARGARGDVARPGGDAA